LNRVGFALRIGLTPRADSFDDRKATVDRKQETDPRGKLFEAARRFIGFAAR